MFKKSDLSFFPLVCSTTKQTRERGPKRFLADSSNVSIVFGFHRHLMSAVIKTNVDAEYLLEWVLSVSVQSARPLGYLWEINQET